MEDYDFEATIIESKQTGQKMITIPFGVRNKYKTGTKLKIKIMGII